MPERTFPARRTAASMLVTGFSILGIGVSAAEAPTDHPGTVVSSHVLAETELITSAAKGYRIIYRTTGQRDEPEVSGGNIYLPGGEAPPGGWPVISWAHSTSGIARGCAPNLRGGFADTFDERPEMSAYLAQGYAVLATDYIGLGAPGEYQYLAGRAAGHAVLDIVRAGRALDAGLSNSYALAGHSIGGQSALYAAHTASRYAPELDLRGTLAFAPTSNYEDLITALSGPDLAVPLPEGLQIRVLMIMAGLDQVRPDLRVLDHLSDRGRQVLALAEGGAGCLSEASAAVADRSFGELFVEPLSDPALITAFRDYMAVPTTGYHRPVVLVQGGVDTVQPMPTTTLLQQQLQHGGVDSRLRFYPSATHFTLMVQARSDTDEFLGRVLPPP
ncbi:alpha/beta fold hydrolase [Nocardia sp. NPDC003345]